MAPTFARAVLLPTRRPVSLDTLRDALVTAVVPAGELVFLRELPPVRAGWFLGDPALVFRWVPELTDGPTVPPVMVVIDAPARPLPTLGAQDSDLAAAYALGSFGPGATPGCLARASQATSEWSGAVSVAAAHNSLVRVRLTFALGGGETPDASVRNRDTELALLLALAAPLLDLPEVLAWFHAPGERLCSRSGVVTALSHAKEDGRLPVELWTHLRAWQVGDADDWVLYDTVGMPSLGVRDLELAARADQLSASDAATFLRNLSLYALAESDPFKSGHTA
jgi:hypothetical protein